LDRSSTAGTAERSDAELTEDSSLSLIFLICEKRIYEKNKNKKTIKYV
jgi:hypothetical protein